MKRYLLLIPACLALAACAGFVKTPRETAIEQCSYGVNVPNNIDFKHRAAYIKNVAVPGCMRAKGWSTTGETE